MVDLNAVDIFVSKENVVLSFGTLSFEADTRLAAELRNSVSRVDDDEPPSGIGDTLAGPTLPGIGPAGRYYNRFSSHSSNFPRNPERALEEFTFRIVSSGIDTSVLEHSLYELGAPRESTSEPEVIGNREGTGFAGVIYVFARNTPDAIQKVREARQEEPLATLLPVVSAHGDFTVGPLTAPHDCLSCLISSMEQRPSEERRVSMPQARAAWDSMADYGQPGENQGDILAQIEAFQIVIRTAIGNREPVHHGTFLAMVEGNRIDRWHFCACGMGDGQSSEEEFLMQKRIESAPSSSEVRATSRRVSALRSAVELGWAENSRPSIGFPDAMECISASKLNSSTLVGFLLEAHASVDGERSRLPSAGGLNSILPSFVLEENLGPLERGTECYIDGRRRRIVQISRRKRTPIECAADRGRIWLWIRPGIAIQKYEERAPYLVWADIGVLYSHYQILAADRGVSLELLDVGSSRSEISKHSRLDTFIAAVVHFGQPVGSQHVDCE